MTTPRAAARPAPKLPLPHYAAVKAATAEGFGLDEVLALEGIEPPAWARADRAWKAKISGDAGEMGRYEVELGAAEDWLARRVDPLREDLAGWLAFLDAYAAHEAPAELLARLSLGVNDLSRLARAWRRRAAEDPLMDGRIATLRRRGLAPLPRVQVAPAVLRRSRWAEERASAQAPPSTSGRSTVEAVRTVDLGLEIYAAIRAEVEAGPQGLDDRLRRLGIASPEALASLDARWKRQFERDPTLERDLRRLVAHRRALARGGGAKGKGAAVAPSAPTPMSPPPSVSMVTLPTTPVAARAPAALAGTSLALDLPRGPALPFTSTPPPAQPDLRDEPRPSRPPDTSLTGTSRAMDVPAAFRLPFAAAGVARPPPALAGTSLALDVPRGPALPFLGAAAAVPSLEAPAEPVEPMPWLSIEQHAALTAELAAAPGDAEAILARHRITPACKAAIDRHYSARVRAIPEVRGAWHGAYAAYFAGRTERR